MQTSKIYRLLLTLIFTCSSTMYHYGYPSEKRFQKAVLKLDKEMLNQKRAWPYNYTFNEYLQQLDNTILRQEFYRKRASQAKEAGDERTLMTMKRNIESYQETIDRLKDDKKFYNVYKLRQDEIKIKIRQEEIKVKMAQKQEVEYQKTLQREANDIEKRKKQLLKEKQKKLDDNRHRLETQIAGLKKEAKTNTKRLSKYQKELYVLEEIIATDSIKDDPSINEGKTQLTYKINELNFKQDSISTELDIVTANLDKFIEENYSKKDTIVEKQMILSTDYPTID